MTFSPIPSLNLPEGSSQQVIDLHAAAANLQTAHNALLGTGASDLEKLTSEVEARKAIATFLAAVASASATRATAKHRTMAHKSMRAGFTITGYPALPRFHDSAAALSAENLEATRVAQEQAANTLALFGVVEGLAEQVAELASQVSG